MNSTQILLGIFQTYLRFDPEVGLFYWLKSTSLKVCVGDQAGTVNRGNSYAYVHFHGIHFRAHRLAWLFMYGRWPVGQIDHINGVRHDNRIANLRDVPPRVNSQNMRRAHKDCASGLLGAYFSKETGRWYSNIKLADRQQRLGTFDTAQQAHEAYVAAKRIHHLGNTL